MINATLLEEVMFTAVTEAAVHIPPDVKAALERALATEETPLARQHLTLTLQNAELASRGKGLVCGDTGFPLFFVRVHGEVEIEKGYAALHSAARRAVVRATEESFLRPTMVDPLTRDNPGNNLGGVIPAVEIEFIPEEKIIPELPSGALDIVAVPKGGGSEIFGTFYRMMYPADGAAGVRKFIVDAVRRGSYAGKVCPPAIVGVGIGGTSDVCMHLAKKAAVLRRIGSRNPDPRVAEMEEQLEAAFRELGLGPMGSAGRNAVLAVHIQTEVTHTAALPVAVNAQCCIGRRRRAVIYDTVGTDTMEKPRIEYSGEAPDYNYSGGGAING